MYLKTMMAHDILNTSTEPSLGVAESFPGERMLAMGAAISFLTVSIILVVCLCSPKCYLHKKCSKKKKDEEEYLTPSTQDNSTGTFHSFFAASPLVAQWKNFRGYPSKELQQHGRSRSSLSLASASSNDLLSEPKVAVEINVRWDEQAKTCTMELTKMMQLDVPRKYRDTMMTLTTIIQIKDSFRSTYTKLQKSSTGYIARQNSPTHLDEKIVTHLTSNVSKAVLTFDVRPMSVLVANLPLWETSLPLMPLLTGDVAMSIPLLFPLPEKHGEVVISVCYMPVAEKLSVSLLECQGLDIAARQDLDKIPDFYTKIALMRHGKILARKRTKVQAIKPIVMLTEAFTFDVPRAHADQIKIIVTVVFLGKINGQLVEERLGRATFAADTHPSWSMVLKQTRKLQIMRQDIL